MNFGTALQHIRIGAKLRRKNWAGMLIYLVPASEFPYELARGPVKELFEPGDTIKYRAHIDYLAFDGSIGVYDFKQEDVLADDWEFVEGQVLYEDVDPEDFEEVEDQFAAIETTSTVPEPTEFAPPDVLDDVHAEFIDNGTSAIELDAIEADRVATINHDTKLL